ncbi:MAG TPA: DUF4062 domain-containing protein [Candidatus Corynebacterium avicola]|uniref:DUF4062 domain-containing protein n=1 Tax=Candidatus Corynebacterium avicola TaxID=2838527 RepID=A0A9D1RTK6_9CORY|nr:DUF4062 domain-containing protein [Candidatus Corynebacterium avicola]
MTLQLTGVLVLIASPGDTQEERAIVRETINDWNINSGRRMGVALLPWLYERSAVPTLGNRPQAIINSQAVDRADVVVAFFDSRLGTDTGVNVSGTAEEILRAHTSGKPVHVYFSNENIPRDANLDQQIALRDFRQGLQDSGLLGDYNDPHDLAGQVIHAIVHDIDEAGWGGSSAPQMEVTPPGAQLAWHHEHEERPNGVDKRGKQKYTTTRNQLVVENSGNRAAENLTFTVNGVDGCSIHRGDLPTSPLTLEAESTRTWTMIPLSSGTVEITAEWTEAGEPKTAVRTIAVRAR